MHRTYKRKMILTKAQEERLSSWIGACRLIYNMGLELKITSYKLTGKSIHRFALQSQLKDLKDIPWMADTPFIFKLIILERLEKSFSTFFRTHKNGGGFPKFASKKRFNSIETDKFNITPKGISLPKIGVVKIFKDSPILGTPKRVIIKREPKGFFICIQCADVPPKFTSENQAIGLDMGVAHFCINSNGEFIANPKHFKKYERRIRIENRSLARKKKGSGRWKKQAKRLSVLQNKIGNVRMDFLHKESTKIAKTNSVVYLEDLNVVGMVKNRHLSKHILDCGWAMFRTMLEYKTNVIAIDPKHTSQICNSCGTKDAKSRISQSQFACSSCGHTDNADVNAAKNILSRGTALNREREATA